FFLAFMLMAATIAAAIHYRTKKLRLLNKRLSTIISKRTSELVAQREQLRATNNELRVRNTELDNFVYRSSHDLVAPLKSLKGLIQIARHEEEAHNRDNYFRLMHTSIEKLEDFIKSIMEYSSNTKKDILQVPIDMQEVLDSIVADLKYYDKADRIELIRNIDPALVLCSDPKRLKIILSNLITNSIKYHNYYQEKLYIEIKATAVAEGIEISISDNGRGIEEAYLDKIFDMFFRATDSAQGSGLGLYIVKDTVEKLGGSIRVASSFGKGTTFTLFFPKGESQEIAAYQHTSLQE
ncbi:MAG: HAMP domain-containing histidine kinase, partial [Bacteroidetes bacterium]|nr:HAMP domain-containing histidine kinase [Bacteroidota bacterium]